MAVKGIFASDASIQGDRKGDFASALLSIMPTGTAPLYALTSGMRSSPAADTIITWFEENHLAGRTVTTAESLAADTTVDVADASAYTAGTLLLAEDTGEMIYIVSIAANVLTVIRGFGGTTAATIDSGDGLQRIGTAFEEASSRPDAIMNQGYPVFNFTQIFRNSWDVTGTAKAISYYTGSKPAKSRADCMMQHSEDIERSLIWGVRASGTKNGKPFRTMAGINSFISTNVTPAGSTTDRNDLNDFFMDVFSKNIKNAPNERIAFCGNQVVNVINQIAAIDAQINITPGQNDYGLEVYIWRTPFGTVRFMTHPLMNENPVWTKDLYVYHPAAIKTRYLRKTNMDDYDGNGKRAGVDSDYGVVTTELSCEYNAEVTGGIMTGFTAGAAVS